MYIYDIKQKYRKLNIFFLCLTTCNIAINMTIYRFIIGNIKLNGEAYTKILS